MHTATIEIPSATYASGVLTVPMRHAEDVWQWLHFQSGVAIFSSKTQPPEAKVYVVPATDAYGKNTGRPTYDAKERIRTIDLEYCEDIEVPALMEFVRIDGEAKDREQQAFDKMQEAEKKYGQAMFGIHNRTGQGIVFRPGDPTPIRSYIESTWRYQVTWEDPVMDGIPLVSEEELEDEE